MNALELSDDQLRALADAWAKVCGRIMDGDASGGIADQVVLLDGSTWVVIEAAGYPPHPVFRLLQHRPVEVGGRPLRRKFSHGIGFGGSAGAYDTLTHPENVREMVAELLERAEEFFSCPVHPEEKLYPAV